MKLFLLTFVFLLFTHPNLEAASAKALIFGKTIRLIPHGEIISIAGPSLEKYLNENGIQSTFTQDNSFLTLSHLLTYDVLVLMDVSEGVINPAQQKAIESFFNAGRGLVAIHATISAEKDWPWLQELLGTKFIDHAPIQNGTVRLNSVSDKAYANLPSEWSQVDEWFNFSDQIKSPRKIIYLSDESTYSGGKMGKVHPVAWQLEKDKGRFFYTSMGHPAELYSKGENTFLKMIQAAIRWSANTR